MNQLNDILTNLNPTQIHGTTDLKFKQLIFDSRKVQKGDLFFAIKGIRSDGHQYILKAVEAGAVAVICEKIPESKSVNITYIEVKDSSEALGICADQYYGHPSSQLKLVGITGTNGKTSTATLLYNLFSDLGYKTGLLSTVENKIGNKVLESKFTTPDAIGLNELLSDMVDTGCEYAFMEVSSHAIHQKRVSGLVFTGGVFTNLSHDHLDYHKTFKNYIYTKKQFFDNLSEKAFALTNIDDRQGEVMVQNTKAKIFRYSLRKLTDFKAKIVDNSFTGLQLELDGQEFYSRLIGEFNAYNLLAIYATARLLKADKWEVLTKLSELRSAEGRFDYFIHPKNKIVGIVDYAHTPDALEKVLSTINRIRQGNEKIITIIGCGGDRDKQKRPVMAKTACAYSDQVILTSDNPRSEKPDEIITAMEKGVPPFAVKKVLSITNRKSAIKTACRLAQKGDIILLAGKGHEKYQEIKGEKFPFDDKEILIESLKMTE